MKKLNKLLKNNMFLLLGSVSILILFSGCGDSAAKDDNSVATNSSNKILKVNQSIICSDKTHFTVTPTNNPIVTFNTDTSTGDTTISVSSNSPTNSSVEVSNCSQP